MQPRKFIFTLCPWTALFGFILIFLESTNAQWVSVPPMITGRYEHTATTLQNGQVLVAGGYYATGKSGNSISSAELFNPITRIWTNTGSMLTARYNHTATILKNGKVLVIGGLDTQGYILSSAELYDPITGTWTSTGSLSKSRIYHTATLLTNGQVLVSGGDSSAGSSSIFSTETSELYDPSIGIWTNTGLLSTGRSYHTATLLTNGQVLVAGGIDKNRKKLSSAELYNPSNKMWIATGSMINKRYGHIAVLLPSGNVFVAMNMDWGVKMTAEIYDLETSTWNNFTNLDSNWKSDNSRAAFVINDSAYSYKIIIKSEVGIIIFSPKVSTWNVDSGAWNFYYSDTIKTHSASTLLNDKSLLVTGGLMQDKTNGSYFSSNIVSLDNSETVNNSIVGIIKNSQIWVCPPGITNIFVECWGGGSGGYMNFGGAGGSYAGISYDVAPGILYTIDIGSGGSAESDGKPTYFCGPGIRPLVAGGGSGQFGSTNGCSGYGSSFQSSPGGAGGNTIITNFHYGLSTDFACAGGGGGGLATIYPSNTGNSFFSNNGQQSSPSARWLYGVMEPYITRAIGGFGWIHQHSSNILYSFGGSGGLGAFQNVLEHDLPNGPRGVPDGSPRFIDSNSGGDGTMGGGGGGGANYNFGYNIPGKGGNGIAVIEQNGSLQKINAYILTNSEFQYALAFSNLNQKCDGNYKYPTIYVYPENLVYKLSFPGIKGYLNEPGIYPVVVSMADFYSDPISISNNFIISAPENTILASYIKFGDYMQTYDGMLKNINCTTFPNNLGVVITYNGSTNLPIYPGVYDVVATFQTNDLNLQVFNGSVPNDIFTNSLTITKATAELALDDLNQIYNGNPISVKKISEPKNLNTVILYNNSTNLPVYPGSYPVLATIVDSNYTGSATGTLIINKADLILTSLPKSTPITYGQNLASSKLFDGVASVPGNFYFLDPTFVPGAGLNSYSITFVPTNTTNYNIVYNNVNVQVDPVPAVITISNLLQIYTGNPLSVSTAITPPNTSFSVSYNNNSALPVNPGTYQVEARVTDPNYYGSTTNTLVIYPQKPTILQQPTNQTVARGSSVSFSVLAVGTLPLHYQWRSNLVNIASATNSTLTLNNVQTNASAGYRVVITNAYGSVTSSVAQLTVFLQYSPLKLDRTGLGTITGASNNQILTIGNLYKISAKAAKGFVFKNWTNGSGVSLTNSTKLSFLMRSNLSLTANFIETSLPKLTITSPQKNAKLNGSSVGMIGTASDPWAVTNVSYSVNSGAWNSASTGNNYSNWTATVTLSAGTNTIRVYAQNQGGLSSLTNSLKVIATNVLTLNLVINSQNQAPMQARSMAVAVPANKGFTFSLELSAGVPGHIEYSTDLVHWTTWTNFDGSSTLLQFNDPQAGESSRFYRAVTP